MYCKDRNKKTTQIETRAVTCHGVPCPAPLAQRQLGQAPATPVTLRAGVVVIEN